MNEYQDNQGSALAWVIGIGLGIGALVLLARPKKAAAAPTTTVQLLPPFNVPPPAPPAAQCPISGPSFSKFSAWALKKYSAVAGVRVLESEFPPPSLADVNKPALEGGFRLTGSPPFTEESTILVTRAPNEMVWRYHQGQPTAAPEILKGYCDDVAAGTVQGVVWR